MNGQQREDILSNLHEELPDWRRNMPFPPPDCHDQVPHLTTAWYDLNYYTFLAMLYRLFPLCPVLDAKCIKTLETAAAMAIRLSYGMDQQGRFEYSWLNFLTAFTTTITYIYAVTAQPEDMPTLLRHTHAIQDLNLAVLLFKAFGSKFAEAVKIEHMIEEVLKRLKNIRDGMDIRQSSSGTS